MVAELMNVFLDTALEGYARGNYSYDDLIDYLMANESASLELFRRFYISEKNEIFQAIDAQEKIRKEVLEDGRPHTSQFFDRLFVLLDKLREKIEDAYLFQELPDWWAYSVYIDASGVTLRINYYSDPSARPHLAFVNNIEPDQSFDLIKVDSRLLKVDEYAEMFDVDSPAVRQWIRRGKLPSAIKFGREWRIPELCDVGGRSYLKREYSWQGELSELPDSYKHLNEYSSVTLEQDYQDRKKYTAVFLGEGTVKKFVLSAKEREQLELVLISNPMIKVDCGYYANITRKEG